MPSYISKVGRWHAQNERVALKNNSEDTIKNPSTDEKYKDEQIGPGDDYIYSGPCRAALFELWKEKVEYFGEDFRQNPEFLQACRNMGYTDYKKYLKDIGFNEKRLEEEFEKKATVVTKHELPEKCKAIENLAGGRDTAGGGLDMKGDFGLPPGFDK